jgi:DNA polymerase III epsilon subunit-like protein
MKYVMVDIESDGPIPSDYSMIALGAVVVEPSLSKKFSARLKPISDRWIPEALKVSGFSREETLKFRDPKQVMDEFHDWLIKLSKDRLIFISDNNGFDWQFVNWYFHHFIGKNPFGFSSMNLGSFYKGIVRDVSKSFKHLRKTKHTHDPLDDAVGNAEAFLEIIKQFNLNVR